MDTTLYTFVLTYFLSRLAILVGMGYLVYKALRPKMAFARARA
jgi:hypothetical protein